MKWLHTVVGVLLLAFWLPAQGHCALERAGVSWFDDCCIESGVESQKAPASEPCSDQVCCNLESPTYKVDRERPTVIPPILSILFEHISALAENRTLPPSLFGLLDVIPPELVRTWQFAQRTVLPARAPSFAS
ncbi:MAG: hypothetical protein ACK4UN_12325 [Limisphaerales bacterium]